jgi:hypothetical protein
MAAVGTVYVRVPVAQSAAGTTVIVAADADQFVNIHEVNLSFNVTDTFVIKDSAGTVFGTWYVAATGQVHMPFVAKRIAARRLAAGKGLSITTIAAKAAGFITYSVASA